MFKILLRNSNFSKLLAIMWSIFTFAYLTAITFTALPDANIRFADTALGFLLGTVVSSIIGFYYDSGIDTNTLTREKEVDNVFNNTDYR